ncbi:MAG: hypothetical protein RL234_1451, partial [Pseudomonadota bacterium]
SEDSSFDEEFSAKLERAIKDNPDLPPEFVKDILLSLKETEFIQINPFSSSASP